MAEGRVENGRPPVTFSYIPALELAVFADSAGPRPGKPEVLNASAGDNPWRRRVRAAASPFELADLDLLFRPVSTVVFLFYAIIREGHHEVEDLIQYFRSMSESAFLARFKWFLQIDDATEDWIDVDTIELALENDRARETVPFRDEAEQLVDLLSSADTFRRKIVDVLTWLDERLFASDSEMTRRRVESWISEKLPMLENDPSAALDALTGDSYDSLLKDTRAIRIFFVSDSWNSESCLMLPDEAYGVFTTRFADRVLPSDPEALASEQITERAIEALADPNRIALLRLLRRRPHFGREVAQALGVSASTASYHIEKLVAARLARLQLSRGRRFYYGINTRGFQELLDRLRAEFVSETGEESP